MTSLRLGRRRVRTAIVAAFTTAIAGTALFSLQPTAAAAPTPDNAPSVIGKHDEQLLLQAKQRGDQTVTLLVTTKLDAVSEGIEQLSRAGAKIQYRADRIGYVRVEAPVDSVRALAKLSGVSSIDVDEEIPLDDPRPEGQANPTPQPPPDANTPKVNAYMPTGDTGAAQFVTDHPTWDGRGVTVGILDTGIDLGHPSLNTTSTGERKIVDWVTYTDPTFTAGGVNRDNDPTWLLMTGSLPADYTAPAGAGPLKFATFNERDPRLGGELGNDVNRDGNPAGSSGVFGVAWDQASNTVWVDTNQNKNFGDDKPMTDYKVRFDQNQFGTDNPATVVSEAVPFVVQTDLPDNSVNIGIVSGAHGSHVAGIVSGNKLFGGQMSGAAPGAKLVSIRVCLFVAGCTAHALVEGMKYAVENAHVDVINMSIGGLPALNDGHNARADVYNRLIDEGVQMFISAGNDGAGSNTVGDPAVVDKVVAVGAYIRRATWQRDYGSDIAVEESLHDFSSRGPREDGGFKPTIVAPGAAVSSVPTWQQGQPVAGTYTLPPGYGMFNGTSMAAPQSTGAAAVLLSAAFAEGVEHSPAQLRQAITSSARFVPGLQAYEQGNGLFTVDRAWDLLQANIRVTDITSSVPVNTVLAGQLATPGVGVGIHDREGVKAGDSYFRTYTITRNSGPDTPMTYHVRWVGNDGTFSSDPTIQLRKDSAVKFRVKVNPRTAGIHSAIMNLDSPLSTGIEYQTLNTVVAAEDFNVGNGFSIRHGGQIGRNQVTSFFVRVAPGTTALKVDLQGGGAPGAGQVRFLRFSPFGLRSEDNSSLNCYNPPVTGAGCDTGSPTSRTISNPVPGVWEIETEARRTSDVAFAPYTVTASVLGATVSPNPDTIASATLGQPVPRGYDLTNLLVPVTARAAGTPLSSALKARPNISTGVQQQFPLTIPAGTTSLRATIGGASDAGADLDLFVFNCTTGTCRQAGASTGGTAEESVTIANPAAGQWIALVDGFRVNAPSTDYNYLDVFANPMFGSIAVSDANAARGTGTTWTAPAAVTANSAPAAGRILLGNVEIRTDANVLIGSGDVIVQSVS